MTYSRKACLTGMALVLPLLGSTSAICAQDEAPVPVFDQFQLFEASDVAPNKKTIEAARRSQEKSQHRRLQLRIDELKRVCDLKPQQVKRLQLAAKGAVKRSLVGFEDRYKTFRRQVLGGGFAAEVPAAEVGETEAESASDAPAQSTQVKADQPAVDEEVAALLNELGIGFGPFGLAGQMITGDIEQQDLWVSAIRKTLTPEQLAKHQQMVASRKAFRRQSTINHLVAGLDERLLLSEQQRKQLVQVFDDEFGKFIEALPYRQAPYMLESLPHLRATQGAFRRVRQKAGSFLTKDQLGQFNRRDSDDIGWLYGADNEVVVVEPIIAVPDDAGFLGVQLVAADNGVLLQLVTEGLAADKSGLKVGDIVVSFNDEDVSSVNQLVALVAGTKAGDEVALKVEREDETLEIRVELSERPK